MVVPERMRMKGPKMKQDADDGDLRQTAEVSMKVRHCQTSERDVGR